MNPAKLQLCAWNQRFCFFESFVVVFFHRNLFLSNQASSLNPEVHLFLKVSCFLLQEVHCHPVMSVSLGANLWQHNISISSYFKTKLFFFLFSSSLRRKGTQLRPLRHQYPNLELFFFLIPFSSYWQVREDCWNERKPVDKIHSSSVIDV